MTNFRQLTLFLLLIGGIYAAKLEVKNENLDDGLYHDPGPSSTTPEPVYPDGVNTIPGDAEVHYPIYDRIFKTSFSCAGRIAGFYADIDARCQIWHICDVDGRMQSFLCTNGTIFSQATRVCEWWYNSNCEANHVKRNYEHNKDLYQPYEKVSEDVELSNNQKNNNNKPVPLVQGQKLQQPIKQQQPQNSRPIEPTQAQNQANHFFTQKQVLQQAPLRNSQELTKQKVPLNFQNTFPIGNEFVPQSSQIRKNEQSANQGRVPQQLQQQSPPVNQKKPLQQQEVPKQLTNQKREQVTNDQRQQDELANERRAQQQLTREQLEQRRQAARDEFYSVPAKIEQENRIKQQQLQAQQRLDQQSSQVITTAQSPLLGNSEFRQPLVTNPPQPQNSTPIGHFPSPVVPPRQKFRHSTPRKHNVSFRQSPESDERQIPQETQQNGFPFYHHPSQFQSGQTIPSFANQEPVRIRGRKAPPSQNYLNSYLPTSNSPPIEFRPTITEINLPNTPSVTTAITPTKSRTRKRRPRPIKKNGQINTPKVIPLLNLGYSQPPPLTQTNPPPTSFSKVTSQQSTTTNFRERSKGLSRTSNNNTASVSASRVVIKKKLRSKILSSPEEENTLNNINTFPGNSHLEEVIENEFKRTHATQKRCAVVGSGNTFKVLC